MRSLHLSALAPGLLLSLLVLSAPRPAVAADPPADPRVAWLSRNAVRLRSISPTDRDFSDLEPLRKILAGKRMVLLGEATHGDGATFLAKTRLIQFLHEEMGFEVLAFESGLFDCRKVDEALRRGEDPVQAVRRGLFGVWSRSEQVLPLMEYLGRRVASKTPLEVAGFDNQLTGSASYEDLRRDLAAYLGALGSKGMEGAEGEAFGGVLQKLVDGTWEEVGSPLPPTAEQERFLARIESLRREIRGRLDAPKKEGAPTAQDSAFWLQMLESTAALARLSWVPDTGTAEARNRTRRMRDQQMGRNLLWLANERYPGRKIVVWAATFHAARNLHQIDLGLGRPELAESYRTMETLGDGVWRELKERIYTLGVTSHEGSVGTVYRSGDAEPLQPPSPGSLEDLMARAGLEHALVDFRNPSKGGEWLRRPLLSRPLGHAEMKADWGGIVDGMLFLRKMEPSRRAGK